MTRLTGLAAAAGALFLAACGPLTPEAISRAWRNSYQEYSSLQAIATNVCSYRKALEEAKQGGNQDIVSTRAAYLLAQEQQYAAVASRYEAAVRNPLDRGLTRPRDLPERAPSLQAMTDTVCR
jgi:hypothetical protein